MVLMSCYRRKVSQVPANNEVFAEVQKTKKEGVYDSLLIKPSGFYSRSRSG
jgi:hypothetical protein